MNKAGFRDRLCAAAGGCDRSGIGMGVIGQRIAFRGNGKRRRQAGEVLILQRADAGVRSRFHSAMPDP